MKTKILLALLALPLLLGATIETGSSTSGRANVDSNFNLQVVTPTTASQAGFTRDVYVPTSTITKAKRISSEGQSYGAETRRLFEITFNAASTAWHGRIGTNATTMAKAATSNGYLRLNSGLITTTTTGISIYTRNVVLLERGTELRVKGMLRTTNASVTNKQMEFGVGYYLFAAGQANAMNEFVGFRWTTSGGLQAVVATSAGGAASETTTNINGGTPFSDNVGREYEIIMTADRAEFWVDKTFQTSIDLQSGAYALLKGSSYPVIARVFNSGVPASAPSLDIGAIDVYRVGSDDNQTASGQAAGQDKLALYAQPDVLAAGTATHNFPASGTAPTAATGSNTASVLNSTALLGGFFRMNGASITATAHSVAWVSGYQNPAVPTAVGAATNARDLYITGVTVSPLVVTTVLAGGGFTAQWFCGVGATALSTATADADGTTAVAQRAYRAFPLARLVSFGAAAAVATIETGVGEQTVQFTTPIVVHPGEFFSCGLRTLTATAAVTSGTIDGGIHVNGYWE